MSPNDTRNLRAVSREMGDEGNARTLGLFLNGSISGLIPQSINGVSDQLFRISTYGKFLTHFLESSMSHLSVLDYAMYSQELAVG